ncbi:MAG: hypothetical protein BEN19_04105 [Epulopiscium sp. Nuni2H_MBin003]|nr:MAG: hypothetical protein BEN19_04105 [Epulopiscium sp. Nuni2H_MBin003]
MTKSILKVALALLVFKVSIFAINYAIEQMAFLLQNNYGISIDDNLNIYLILFNCTTLFVGFPLYMLIMGYKNINITPVKLPSNQYIIKRVLILLSVASIFSLMFINSPIPKIDTTTLVRDIIFTVILFPIMEEIMFRQSLFKVFGGLGAVKYIAISTTLWAFVAHNMLANIIIAMVAGFTLLGPMYYTTNNILLVIIFHCMINLLFGVLLPIVAPINFYVTICIASIVCLSTIIYIVKIRHVKSH